MFQEVLSSDAMRNRAVTGCLIAFALFISRIGFASVATCAQARPYLDLGRTHGQAANTALSDWLYRWQTLVGSMIAVAAAIVGSLLLYQQIAQAREIERDRRASKLLAVRSVLPLTLSALIIYVQNETFILKEMKAKQVITRFTTLPENVVEVLKEFIEFAAQIEADVVRRILSDFQIHAARMRTDLPGYENHSAILLDTYLAGNIVRLVLTYARISDLFRYARFETERVSPNPTYDEMETAAVQLSVFDDGDVMKLIREDHGMSAEE
jgi:hypothetical protein